MIKSRQQRKMSWSCSVPLCDHPRDSPHDWGSTSTNASCCSYFGLNTSHAWNKRNFSPPFYWFFDSLNENDSLYKVMLEKQIWHTANICMILTDIIVFSARTKLKAQGKGGEELELLWELEWPIRRQRPVALPAFEAFGSVVTWAVAIIVDHVENVAFRPLVWDCTGVVRTVNIKVVVDADVNMVIAPVKAGKEIQYANKYNEHIQYTYMRSHFEFVWNFRIYKEMGKYFAKVLTLLWRLGLTQILSCDQPSWRCVYQELGKHNVYAAVYSTHPCLA